MELRMFSALFCSSRRSVLKLSSPEEAVVRGKGIARTSRRKLEKVEVARVPYLFLRSNTRKGRNSGWFWTNRVFESNKG